MDQMIKMMEIWSVAAIFLLSMVIICITHWAYRWRNPFGANEKLPPGSMGLPFIGETLQLFASRSSFDIHPFIKNRMKKYGPIFKTNLAARPIVISTDPEFSHIVFLEEGKFTETYVPFLESSRVLLEQKNLNMHKYLRNMVLGYFGTEKQKETLLSEMQEMVGRNIAIWSKLPSVDLKEASATMAFGFASKKLLSCDPSKYSEDLKDAFTGFLRGLVAFPLNIPGTAYHKCLKDRKKVMEVLKKMVTERLNYTGRQHKDFLDVIIGEMNKDEPAFNVDGATYIVFAIMLASFETVSLALTLAIKFISEHPTVLQEFMGEHENIVKKRAVSDSAMTWNEYKSMTFTSHIIDEMLRLGNISQLIFRRAKRDIEVNGYKIPSGWGIVVYPPAIHLNPETYEDPLSFNPWRWQGQGSNTASKNFMPFGGGCRLCAGAGYTKLQMSIALHLLATKYRWTKIKGGEIIQKIGVVLPNGLHIKVTENDSVQL